jgi:hypothetical protein
MEGPGFPLPSEIADVPGAEGWRSMYPYFTRFQPEDDQRFWFYNSMHFPEPMPVFDTITAALLSSAEEQAAFDQMLGLCRLVFPYVEDHKFYCEHWFTTLFFQRIREFGGLLHKFGQLADGEDVFHLHHTEIDQALSDVMLAWAAGGTPLGGRRFQEIVAERKRLLEVLRGWSPPPALGPMPEALNDPAVRMLWGITAQTLEAWSQATGSGDPSEVRGYAAAPAWWKGSPGSCRTSTTSARSGKARSWSAR